MFTVLGWNFKALFVRVFVVFPVQWKPLVQRWKCEVQRYRPVLGFCHEERRVPGVSGKCWLLVLNSVYIPLFTALFQVIKHPFEVLGTGTGLKWRVKVSSWTINYFSLFCMDVSRNSDLSVIDPLIKFITEIMFKMQTHGIAVELQWLVG